MYNGSNQAKRDAIVVDFMGRRYVAIHPGYASPTEKDYRCGMATRILVCLLSFAAIVFNVVGQVVPFYSEESRSGVTTYYSSWQQWTGSASSIESADAHVTSSGVLAVVAAAFLLIACVLAGVLAGAWSKDERERLEDRAGSELAMAEFGRPRQAYGDQDDATDDFPYTNLRMVNAGQVREVLYEKSELKRRRYDRDVCAATLSMLIFGAILNVCSVAFMGADYDLYRSEYRGTCTYYSEYYGIYYSYSCNTSTYRVQAGIPLMAVSTALALVTFILVAIPQATKVRLCGKLRPQSCVLMIVEDISPAQATVLYQQYFGVANPAANNMAQGVRVALPGPSQQDMGRPWDGSRENAAFSESDAAVPMAYTTAQYLAPKPKR